MRTLLISLMSSAVIACATQPLAATEENPVWVQSLIASIQQQPVANPPASITRYVYKGTTVYYLSSRCCDIPGKLYDASGSVICEPDGGLTGKGDGKCPDFFTARSDEKLVWKDARGS